MAICCERAVLLAFCSCCSYFIPSKLYVFLSYLVSRAECGFRLYRFLIVAFSFTLNVLTDEGRKAVEGRLLSLSMTLPESFHCFLESITMFLFAMKVRLYLYCLYY